MNRSLRVHPSREIRDGPDGGAGSGELVRGDSSCSTSAPACQPGGPRTRHARAPHQLPHPTGRPFSLAGDPRAGGPEEPLVSDSQRDRQRRFVLPRPRRDVLDRFAKRPVRVWFCGPVRDGEVRQTDLEFAACPGSTVPRPFRAATPRATLSSPRFNRRSLLEVDSHQPTKRPRAKSPRPIISGWVRARSHLTACVADEHDRALLLVQARDALVVVDATVDRRTPASL
jgi:hypothetical protein